jgi:predicted phage replisome organizer
MADVKWIKLYTDMFDNRKIKFIRKLPEGNDILLMWIMLLISAGKVNDEGYVYIIEDIPYTPESLADEFDLPINTIKLGLETMKKLNMIEDEAKGLRIINWCEYQSIESLEKIREQTKLRTRKYRDRLKELSDCSNEPNNSTKRERCDASRDATVTHLDIDIELDLEKELEKDLEKETNKERDSKIPYDEIVEIFHSKCPDLPRVIKVTEQRKKFLNARWKEYPSLDFWNQFFDTVSKSQFLIGKVNDFKANFDWLIRPNNFVKVVEGNYNGKEKNKGLKMLVDEMEW